MSIARTNINLAQFCKEVVGHPYWFGCYGQKGSASLYNSKKKQYPKYYKFDKSTYTDDYGKRVCDCAGLIKWFLWSNNMTDKAPTYKASEDFGANTFYNKCTSKGKIGSLPKEKVGILVFKGTDSTKNHVGVIVDNDGTVVEAKGHNYGIVKSKASSWGYWGKCHLITYLSIPTPTPTPTPTPSKDEYTVKTNSGDSLRLRKEPTTKSAQIGYIECGKTIHAEKIVEGEDIGGCKAWVYNGKGYASGNYLVPTPVIPAPTPTPAPTPKTTNRTITARSGLWLHSRPTSSSSTRICCMYYGDNFVEESRSNGWAYGTWKRTGKKGYASTDYLK